MEKLEEKKKEKKKKRDRVYYKLCNKVMKYSGSTTNMRFHLKEHHRSVCHVIHFYTC